MELKNASDDVIATVLLVDGAPKITRVRQRLVRRNGYSPLLTRAGS